MKENDMKIIKTLINDDHKQWFLALTNQEIANIFNYHGDYIKNIPQIVPRNTPQIAVIKGQIGEKTIYDLLIKIYGNSCVKIKAKDKYSSDIIITRNKIVIIIEIKNYTSKVPTHQVKKFIRDCETTNCDAGLFVSLKSAITRKNDDMEFTDILINERKIPAIYLNLKGNTRDTEKYLKLLIDVLFISVKLYKCSFNKEHVKYFINEIKETLLIITNSRYELTQFKESINKTLDKIIVKNVSIESRLRNNIKYIESQIESQI